MQHFGLRMTSFMFNLLPNLHSSDMNKRMEMIDILQQECRNDYDLLNQIIEEYVLGLSESESDVLEDFIVNNFGEL
jgi:hypothetical protein